MAFVHGKDSVFKIDNDGGTLTDISAYVNSVDFPQTVDVAETTVLGKDNKTYIVGNYKEDHKLKENYGPVVIPEENCFVMGDNRDNSADSRTWGFLPNENIVGKAGFVYWSWDRLYKKVRWSRIGTALK